MASLTIGSVGDIITICDILRTVVQALSESRGSATEYQALVRELQALSQAVYSVRSLLERHQDLKEIGRLQDLLKDCRGNLIRELERIQPYGTALQSCPSVSAVKIICRKIRWLTGKDERATFRAAIASHILALSAILATSGIYTQHEIHHATVGQLEQGFEELRLAIDQSSIAHVAEETSFEDALEETKTALITRHYDSDRQALLRHVEINRKLEALHTAVSGQQGPIENSMTRINPPLIRNRVYLMLIIKLLTELTSMGLIGAYHFLQLIQLMMSHRALHFFPQSKCLIVEDAILRSFIIDVDFMSYEAFTKLIEDNFASTPGSLVVASKQYFFEDKKRRPLNLDGVWSSEILKGKTVFMRARVIALSLIGNPCPACGISNEGPAMYDETSCACGCRYTTASVTSAVNSVSQIEMLSMIHAPQATLDIHKHGTEEEHHPTDPARFFKRVEKASTRFQIAPITEQERIKFKDAIGRKFDIPFRPCKTWKGMEEMIHQIFQFGFSIKGCVLAGHYDLMGPDDEIILPQQWEATVQPGWTVSMHMWPTPSPPRSARSGGKRGGV